MKLVLDTATTAIVQNAVITREKERIFLNTVTSKMMIGMEDLNKEAIHYIIYALADKVARLENQLTKIIEG